LPLSLVYADDLVEALLLAAERGERLAAGAPPWEQGGRGVYYAADPRVSSYAEMGRLVAAALGRKVWVLNRRKYPFLLPALASDLAGRLRGKPPVFGRDKLREASASGWVCLTTKAADQLGFAPAASLEERFRQTAAWNRENGWL